MKLRQDYMHHSEARKSCHCLSTLRVGLSTLRVDDTLGTLAKQVLQWVETETGGCFVGESSSMIIATWSGPHVSFANDIYFMILTVYCKKEMSSWNKGLACKQK